MKCPTCEFNQKFSDGMKCRKCGYLFSLNPKETRMTDGRMLAAIRRASQNGQVVFTFNQLYAAFASRQTSFRTLFLFAAAIFGIMGTLILLTGAPIGWVMFIPAALALMGWFISPTSLLVLSRERFRDSLDIWVGKNNPVPGLIDKPTLHEPPPNWDEPDMFDYGVEQVLIVQHDLLVDVFVLSQQHAELKALVMAESGYPEYLRDKCNQLLRERPDLPLFLYHDADETGQAMATRIKSSPWLKPGDNPVIDLGLQPSDSWKLKQTDNYRSQYPRSELPADAIPLSLITAGMGGCFISQQSFAEELVRMESGTSDTNISFG